MNESLFQVSCPSCEACFEVSDPQLVGQIVACPKCGGMMLVEPNDQTSADEETNESVAPQAETRDAASNATECESDAAESFDAATDPSDPEAMRAEIEKRRAGRALAAVLGVFSAALLVGAFAFARAYLANAPKPNENARESANEENVANEDLPLDDVSVVDDSASDAQEQENAEDLELESDNASNVDGKDSDENEIALAIEDEPSETVSTEFEDDASPTPDDVPLADAASPDSASDAPSDELDVDELFADDAPIDLEDGERGEENEDDEEPIAESALTAEFDQAEFDKANQAVEEEQDAADDAFDLDAASATESAAQTPLPELKTPAKEIDVDARLRLPIKSIVFPESPVAALRLLSEFSGVPISLDLEQIPLLRASFNRRLELKLADVDVGAALEKEAELLKWKIDREKDRAIVGVQESDLVVEARFEIDDLLEAPAPVDLLIDPDDQTGDLATTDALVAFARSLAALEDARVDGDALLARGNAVARKRVELLLEQLRAARGIERRTDVPDEELVAENLGWQTLSRKTNFNLLTPASLQQAAEILENKFKFLVYWDDASLNAEGVGRDSSTRARIESASVEQILSAIFEPHKLSFVVLDEKLILALPKDAADRYFTTEIHQGFDSENAKDAVKFARARAKELIASVGDDAMWRRDGVALWFDPVSERWFARQAQPTQREIRRWFAAKNAKDRSKKTDGARASDSNESPRENEPMREEDPAAIATDASFDPLDADPSAEDAETDDRELDDAPNDPVE